jgi:sulfate permease, SulP family
LFVPKLVTTLRGYTGAQLAADTAAGLVVGIVALPLSIAFAIASGVTPDRGLYTAVIAGFLISALGGSRVQIGGPTGAFVVIVYGIVQVHGIDGLVIATVMAGLILIALGLARFGAVIKFIPHPVVVGFTSGIALLIFSSQIRDLLGLEMGEVPPGFLERWIAYAEHLGGINPHAIVVAGLALAILILWPRWTRRLPAPFVALVVTTGLVALLDLRVETLGDRFGSIPSSLPMPSLPAFDAAMVVALIGPAFTIALLAGVESLLSAVVADGMIGGRHRSNMELVAQGIANVVTPLFGGIPATGAIARTATNVRNGGRTPVAGIVHALTLLLILLIFGPLAAYIPFATLAAILTVVAYHMSEWRVFRAEFRAPRSDLAVLLTTFILTVAVDLTVAIEVGMVLAAFLFVRRMAEVTNVHAVTREFRESPEDRYVSDPNAAHRREIPPGVEVYEINGPFFFGAAEAFRERVGVTLGRRPRVLIIRMRNVPAIDSTGLHALTGLIGRNHGDGVRVILADVHAQPLVAIGRSFLLDELGEENVFGNLDDALNAAREHLGGLALPPPAGAEPTVAREQGRSAG